MNPNLSSRYPKYFSKFGKIHLPKKTSSSSDDSENDSDLKNEPIIITNQDIIEPLSSTAPGFDYTHFGHKEYIDFFNYNRDMNALTRIEDPNEGFKYKFKTKFGSVSPIMKKRPKTKEEQHTIPQITKKFYIPTRNKNDLPSKEYEIFNHEPFYIRRMKSNSSLLVRSFFVNDGVYNGYYNFVYFGNNKWERRDLIIGYTFVPRKKNENIIHHINGNTRDDHYRNLVWFKSPQYNDYSDYSD